MSDGGSSRAKKTSPPDDESSRGPNLALYYSLIGFALLVAIILAGLIVLPFYRHRS